MKIVYISNSIIPSRTANSIHVMKMCQAFADNGHEVVLLAPNRYKEYENGVDDVYEYYGVRKNFEIKKLWWLYIKGSSFIYSLAIFFYFLFNKKPDIVYGRFLHGCYVATLFKRKVIFESHAPIYEKKSYELKLFENLIKSKYFQKLVVISQALKNMYLENGYLSDNKIQVAHDGADEVVDFETKAELLGDKDSLKVAYVGHLYKGKGIEVIALIADKVGIDVEFHIIGGLEKDIKFWKEKINSENVFFYGFVPQKEVGGYINALDVCLLPNQKVVLPHGAKDNSHNISDFTSPLKMFEYMAHKKAIVCSDIPVLREVLNEKNSILVDAENSKEWIQAIERLKNNELRQKLSQKAYGDFTCQYSWTRRSKEVI
ncbi:glycosyltransferase family 4 protein [Aliarcobacter skirrowii]|uniref:glycosyltransferase family 4 protein n=1 Tax=Aliarcobacter skirrowii TaxID=28200 RepID=UPI000825ABD1|nr:glycosyltransferase family 4 protein [Aliarcobacter skirrowii]